MSLRRLLSLTTVLLLVALPLAGGFIGSYRAHRTPATRQELAAQWWREGKVLLQHDLTLLPAEAARTLQVDVSALGGAGLFVAPADNTARDFVYCTADGRYGGHGVTAGRGAQQLVLRWNRLGLTLNVDGRAVFRTNGPAQVCWVSEDRSPPATVSQTYPVIALYDGFMRDQLEQDDWQVEGGQWRLNQHGGGVPTTEAQFTDATFQRAVNPFTVLGSGSGWLTHRATTLMDGHVEARTYFGKPRLHKVIDLSHLPTDTDLLVAVGPLTGAQVAFGWRGALGAFALLTRSGSGPWQVLQRCDGPRPPLTNWVKIGLDLQQGSAAVGYLDGAAVAHADLPALVAGPVHLGCGASEAEFDDVRVWTFPAPPEPAAPLFVQSRNFAAKAVMAGHDPAQFEEWAYASNTFVPSVEFLGGKRLSVISSRLPLFGDITYESVPHHDVAGDLPPGLYEFRLLAEDPAAPLDLTKLRCVWRLRLLRDAEGWLPLTTASATKLQLDYGQLVSAPPPAALPASTTAVATAAAPADPATPRRKSVRRAASFTAPPPLAIAAPSSVATPAELPAAAWPADHHEFTLRWTRHDGVAGAGTVLLRTGDAEHLVGAALPAGPLHVAVARMAPGGLAGELPSAEHHDFRAGHLINEFFEEAPTEWSWLEGAFRMDARWACQNQWNFMACAGTGVPMAVSKKTFSGDQIHEFYVSLRPNFPWDAGDETFSYDPGTDAGFNIFIAHEGWYSRHDLNFTFCGDGKNPFSGYTIVFAGDDNTMTKLYRQGQEIASKPDFFIPRDQSHHVIHWRWWNFRVVRQGQHVRVWLDGQPLFSFDDPQPLTGGHLAFWTVRNGFTISRITSQATDIGREPQVLYVPPSTVPAAAPGTPAWQPWQRDSVRLTAEAGGTLTRVTGTSAVGFQAVRWQPAKPVDLRQTPVLDLPITPDATTAVNVYLEIGGQPYLWQLTAPLAGSKAFLAPSQERDEQFRLTVVPAATVQTQLLLGSGATAGHVRADLLAALTKLKGGATPANVMLTAITVGNTSNDQYLLAGRGSQVAAPGYFARLPSYVVGPPTFSAAAPAK